MSSMILYIRPGGSRKSMRIAEGGNARDIDTFEPKVLSLPKGFHQKLVEGMGLPYSWIETSSTVGPFYWSSIEENGGDPCLQLEIIYRKSDVKKIDNPRNWELVLSHSLTTGITNGFFKGTPRSDVNRCITCLQQRIGEIDHPMFLPALIFSLDIDAKEDRRHRDNRERVRELEKTVTEASHIYADPDITKRDHVNLAKINSTLVDCHKEVLWKRPEGYMTIISKMEKTLAQCRDVWPEERRQRLETTDLIMERRLELLMSKLQGISTHREVTISRLKLIGSVLQNLVSLSIFRQEQQRRFKKLERSRTDRIEKLRDEERRGKERAQREVENMLETRKQTTMSLLGILFLPGTFLAAIFSTSFFNFQSGENAGLVSKKFYIYWAVTIPTTVFLFLLWILWKERVKQILEEREEKFLDVEDQVRKEQTAIYAEDIGNGFGY
ncbi:Mg2+ transporter -like Zinc transport protein [Rutstroemia sp. NJR-2017a BBW]|nr:Mg2+ transporter -like Zinc transport protein [Rutstroemia sp. NJR-2017a BBW]